MFRPKMAVFGRFLSILIHTKAVWQDVYLNPS